LRKREQFRRAFRGFDVESLSRFTARSVDRLMLDAGIARNRAKIEATINNAKRCRELLDEVGSLAGYIWRFEPDAGARPKVSDWETATRLAMNAEAKALSKDLKRRGWSFVGPTILFSAIDSIGLVNDHLDECHFRREVERDRSRFVRPVLP
jgi:DNA-3-methyladenine glycosylase I